MSRLSDLIAQAKRENPRLGTALEQEFHARTNRTFGLMFERHLPEEVELPGRPVRRGDTVHVLPPRGSNEKPDPRTWRVISTERTDTGRVAQLVEARAAVDEQPEMLNAADVADLVVTAEQDDVIYPGLVQTGEVIGSEDPDAPFHSVINSENYHALKMLTYTHYHSIDCIYIDPPYNTGAKDWKYNNDYVDGDDGYRHSKWLSFMERRLLVAKQLLNPDDSVLIVTIDEKEYLRLGMLLEQTFPEARIQMVTSVINRAGSSRSGEFARVEEYVFYVMFGSAIVQRWTKTMLNSDEGKDEVPTMPTVWFTAMRRGTASAERSAWANGFYPVIIDRHNGSFIRVDDPIPEDMSVEDYPLGDTELAIWPIAKSDGKEQVWRFSAERMREYFEAGTARLGRRDTETGHRPITYLQPGTITNIEKGVFKVAGKTEEGSLILELGDESKAVTPRSVWDQSSHFARDYGSTLIKTLLGGKRFTFPKSLYVVEDSLRFAVANKPDATILDFFSGSGTTAHAVMRLNKQDGGRRRSILVTNNEVSAEEQVKLRKQGLRPGDPEWEQWGICDYVTKPRVEAAITGRTPAGDPIKGDYKFTDTFPMSDGFDANARFFTLTYEPPTRVRHNRAFAEIAPMLWLRAGQTGRIIDRIPDTGWDLTDAYGVIENVAASEDFVAAVQQRESVKVVYIVTNDDLVFESMARELADTGTELVRLYSTYLNNFAFQQTRENY